MKMKFVGCGKNEGFKASYTYLTLIPTNQYI